MAQETVKVARLDRTQPPPGYRGVRLSLAYIDASGREVPGTRAAESDAQAIAAAWAHYEREHDPPGMWARGGGRGDFASLGQFGADGADISLVSSTRWTRATARAAAWAWYWRRVALAGKLEEALVGRLGEFTYTPPRGKSVTLADLLPVWPRALAWPDEQVAAVERWLAQGGELPEVLRA